MVCSGSGMFVWKRSCGVVERWYDMTVVYEDESVRDLHFGFNMSRLETIEPLLNIFELNGKIKITKEGKVLKIKRGR